MVVARQLSIVIGFLLGATGASAATLNVSGGQLLGAFDVDVGGSLYDVAFVDGTCIALFDGCDTASDFTFTTFGSALSASQALLDQVLVDGVDGLFDSTPANTSGCSAANCNVFTPFGVSGFFVDIFNALNTGSSDSAYDVIDVIPNNYDLSTSSAEVWAVWTPVPEPSTGLFLAMGLAGLGLRRRTTT